MSTRLTEAELAAMQRRLSVNGMTVTPEEARALIAAARRAAVLERALLNAVDYQKALEYHETGRRAPFRATRLSGTSKPSPPSTRRGRRCRVQCEALTAARMRWQYGVRMVQPVCAFRLTAKLSDIEPERRRGYMRRFYWRTRSMSRRNKVLLRRLMMNTEVPNV